jgi:hypothetical protein
MEGVQEIAIVPLRAILAGCDTFLFLKPQKRKRAGATKSMTDPQLHLKNENRKL